MRKIIGGFIIGVLAALCFGFLGYQLIKRTEPKTQNDYYIITNQIKKMNKMVVMEQDFSTMQRTKITREIFGGMLPGTDKSIITLTKTNAQVTYDLNKMVIDVDSINKKLIITSLPNPEIKVIPSVEIQSMDDSFIDRFTEDDLKKITKSAKDKAFKSINETHLKSEGKKQLKENLDQIFVLAKALQYTIEDKTGEIETTQL